MSAWTKEMADAHNRRVAGEKTQAVLTEELNELEGYEPCKNEKAMHDQFSAWLRVHEHGPIPFVHSAMNRKSTVREGLPDYVVMFQGKVCCCEFKVPGKKPTDIQTEVITEFSRAGVATRVCWSVTEAIEFCREKLGL